MKLTFKQQISLIIFISLFLSAPVFNLQAKDDFPKLANYYLPWDVSDNDAKLLSKWDLVILHTQAVDRNPDLLTILKQNNPKIKILAYFVSQEIAVSGASIDPAGAWGRIYNQVNQNNWWLRDTNNNTLSFWPGAQLINVTNNSWTSWLPQFINQNYLSREPKWDGIFYDNCWGTIDWLQYSLDLNRDGQIDNQSTQNAAWQIGLRQLLANTRNLIGPDKLIVCNGGTTYRDLNNGRMFETFPLNNEGGWNVNLNDYQITGDYSIINVNTKNRGNQGNLQQMRFGLASALMGAGFYSFDYGDQNHGQLWWYDEYNTYLGKPLGAAVDALTNLSTRFNLGVYKRDFENGIALVNSSNQSQTFNFVNRYERIKGTIDSATNNGAIITSLTLNPADGAVLLKPLDHLPGAVFSNGNYARVFNANGASVRNGFFAYEKNYTGGSQLLIKDVNNDGQKEVIKADDNAIYYYGYDGRLISKFQPYGEKFHQGINFLVEDLNNDGRTEIITAPKSGTPAHIKTFSLNGRWLNPGFFAFDQKYKNGAVIALADLKGDGQKEIIVGPGAGSVLPVKIFNQAGKEVMPSFYPFGKKYTLGLSLAAGKINQNEPAQIIIGKLKGSATVNIFSSSGSLLKSWEAFKNSSKGVEVRAVDIDGDGVYEIITLTNFLL